MGYDSRSYLLDEEQVELQLMVRDFAQKELIPNAASFDENGTYSQETLQKGLEMGLHLMEIPEKFGGMGLSHLTEIVLREELGYGDAGFAITVGGNGLGYTPLAIAGTEEQIKYFSEIVVNGAVSAFCLTEAGGGSDVSGNRTTAAKVGDEYIINGTKAFITNGDIAQIYTVVASTDKDKGARGMSAFMVDRNTPGITIGSHENKMGIRTSHTVDMSFEDVKVPAKNLIGREGDGFKIAMMTLDRTRPSGVSAAVGIMQRSIDECIKYSKERVVFGKPIAKQQAVAFMIADMEIKCQTARSMVRHCGTLMDNGIYDTVVGSIAKTFTSDSAVQVTTDAVQVLGGYGYSKDYPVEKLMRDAKIYQIFEGTNQIQRIVISNNLLK